MKTKLWVETPFGNFTYIPTDLSKGSSCTQCAAYGIVTRCQESNECCEFCLAIDTKVTHYHLERRTK